MDTKLEDILFSYNLGVFMCLFSLGLFKPNYVLGIVVAFVIGSLATVMSYYKHKGDDQMPRRKTTDAKMVNVEYMCPTLNKLIKIEFGKGYIEYNHGGEGHREYCEIDYVISDCECGQRHKVSLYYYQGDSMVECDISMEVDFEAMSLDERLKIIQAIQ